MSDPHKDNLGYWTSGWPSREPDRIAIIDLHGGIERTITYGALDARLDRVAHALHVAGLKPGDRMILSCGNRVEFIEAMFGAMRAGVVPVPINTRQGPDVLAHVMKDSAPRGVIAEPDANAAILALAGSQSNLALRLTIGGTAAGFEDYEGTLASVDAAPFEPPELGSEALCFLSYTSGSTGLPKGVPLTHAGQCWWLNTYLTTWPPGEDLRNLVAVPLYHKNAMAGAVKPRLASGGSLVLMPEFSARPFLQAIANYCVTHISGVPTVFTLLLEERDLLASLDLSSLQLAVVGSAPVHEELEQAMADKLGVPVLQSYGLTEGGPVMLGPPPDGRPVPRGSAGAAWPVGEVKLVSVEGKESDAEGELWVRNPGVAPGYYNLPEVNAERYRDGWLRTGDLFRKDTEGFFYFQGRVDDMFNCGGENVYPREVENLLLSHPDVVDACVVALPHATKGEAPAALVVLRAGANADEDELKAHSINNGPAYAHPRRIAIQREPLPLTGARKVDRNGIGLTLSEQFGTLG
ncbi:MAG: class I adenylate-forming enzyme family protein [Pseudomonadota bacterium]